MTDYYGFKKRGKLDTSHPWFETSCKMCKNCLYSSTGNVYACLDMPEEETTICSNYRKPGVKMKIKGEERI